MVRHRRDGHRAVRAAAPEHDVGVGHQGRVRRTAGHHQAAAAVSMSPTVKARARGRRPRRSSDPQCRDRRQVVPPSPSARTCRWPSAVPSVTVTVIVAVPTGSPPASPSPSGSPRCPRTRCSRWAPTPCSTNCPSPPGPRRRLRVAHRERQRARRPVLGDRLVRDVRDRRR